jgi:hypothetical protein
MGNTTWPLYNNNNGYSALEPVWQEPEPSQATGMALIRCILGKFLGVVCHCFPPAIVYDRLNKNIKVSLSLYKSQLGDIKKDLILSRI